MRSCIGDRSWASSTTTWPNVRDHSWSSSPSSLGVGGGGVGLQPAEDLLAHEVVDVVEAGHRVLAVLAGRLPGLGVRRPATPGAAAEVHRRLVQQGQVGVGPGHVLHPGRARPVQHRRLVVGEEPPPGQLHQRRPAEQVVEQLLGAELGPHALQGGDHRPLGTDGGRQALLVGLLVDLELADEVAHHHPLHLATALVVGTRPAPHDVDDAAGLGRRQGEVPALPQQLQSVRGRARCRSPTAWATTVAMRASPLSRATASGSRPRTGVGTRSAGVARLTVSSPRAGRTCSM